MQKLIIVIYKYKLMTTTNLLPFVYKDKGDRVTISTKLLKDRPINDIRGLMISENIELEIKQSYMSFIDAKKKALDEVAELLCVADVDLYKEVYPKFVETVRYLEERGYYFDSLLTSDPDGTWCEEVYRDYKYKPWAIHHYTYNFTDGHIAPIVASTRRYCRLIHRHFLQHKQ